MRKQMAGTGWKMNHLVADTKRYATELGRFLRSGTDAVEAFVLPPFTALSAAQPLFADLGVSTGAQNMHWERAGAWTGEISAPMLVELGCRFVALAHSERLRHFGETYELVGRKVGLALESELSPILCLGETEDEKAAADEVLTCQVRTALRGVSAERVQAVVLAYEPRWAIGSPNAATPDYVAERHGRLRQLLASDFGVDAASRTRIVYGGAVNRDNGPAIAALEDVDGLFVGRAAWKAQDFSKIIEIVAEAAKGKGALV